VISAIRTSGNQIESCVLRMLRLLMETTSRADRLEEQDQASKIHCVRCRPSFLGRVPMSAAEGLLMA
jgi:hypothetical protein